MPSHGPGRFQRAAWRRWGWLIVLAVVACHWLFGDLNAETVAALQKASESLKAQEQAASEREKQYLGIAQEAAKEAEKEPEAKPEEAAPADSPADSTPGEQPGLSVSALDAMQRLVEGQQELEKQKESLKPDIE